MSRTLILIPTYNETENIREVVREVLKESTEIDILVIDDNSPDGTAKVVEGLQKSEPRLFLLNRPRKEGLALAYLDGFRWGLAKGYETFIQMDADLSHPPSSIPTILEAFKTYDVVIGSRYIEGGGTSGWSWLRKLISRGGNIYATSVLFSPIHDMTGGFNGWTKHVLQGIDFETVRSKGYAYQVEMKFRSLKRGYKILEIPIHFKNRTLGKSKMSGSIVREAALRVIQLRYQPFV